MDVVKMSSIKVIDMNNCFGCSACSYICPKSAIVMQSNNEGFLYPTINNSCVDCGLCLKVCPTIEPEKQRKKTIKSLSAYLNDQKVYKNSSSGGLFAACAMYFLKQGGLVVGAELLPDYSVKHTIISSIEDLHRLQGSKYVQSNIMDVYSIIEELLRKDKFVLFSGTSCQVVVLVKAMKERKINTEKLFTIDIVCHGVPSPLFFQEHMKNTYGRVTKVKFRHKTKHELSSYAIGFEKNGKYKIIARTNKDFYYACYSSQVSLRESCYRCPFTNPDRVGDITLGDLATHRLYSVDDYHTCSIVAINSEKGGQVFDCLKNIEYSDVDYELETKSNTQMSRPTVRPVERDSFYLELFRDGIYNESAVSKYKYVDSIKSRIKHIFRQVTTPVCRKKLKTLIKK